MEPAAAGAHQDRRMRLLNGLGKAVQAIYPVVLATKRSRRHFDDLERLEEIRRISKMANIAYVRQGEPRGLGDAVMTAPRSSRSCW